MDDAEILLKSAGIGLFLGLWSRYGQTIFILWRREENQEDVSRIS